MEKDEGPKTADAPKETAPAIPKSITTPYFTRGFKEVLTIFIQKLLRQGIPRDRLNTALGEMLPEMQRIAGKMNDELLTQATDYLVRKNFENLRSDYLGRALCYCLEDHFPKDVETGEKLTTEPVDGMIPHHVAQGLINALKSAHGMDTIKKYQELANQKAESYRSEVDLLIDIPKFMADQEVREMVKDITTRFRLLMHKKSEADQRKWLLNMISTSHEFKSMRRDLTEREVAIIHSAILKK